MSYGSFSYSREEAPVFRGINFSVQPGEFVVITGSSGAGKSTILKVIAGLYDLTAGKIYFDDIERRYWDIRELRKSVGVVLQDDTLLKGSIAENVSFFSDQPDMERIEEVCKAVGIIDDIKLMPLGFLTQIGELSMNLSGGQLQRLVLARALYRQPKLLILDEATSNLDSVSERRVLDALLESDATIIMAAHRQSTINAADRRFELRDGRLREYRKRSEAVVSSEPLDGISPNIPSQA